MKKQDYTTRLEVNASAEDVFKSINGVSKWWTQNLEGNSQKLNDSFTLHFGETFITLALIESIPGKKIVWCVTDCNKHWLKNKKEWKGTQIVWDISATNKITQVNLRILV